jgi:hypothetical protein
MELVYSPSTRLRIVAIAVIVAGVREIARRYEFHVSDDVFFMVEASLLALAGLDTVRPLGLKPAKIPTAVRDVVVNVLTDSDSAPTDDPPAPQ